MQPETSEAAKTPYLLRVACPRCLRFLDPASGVRVDEFYFHPECLERIDPGLKRAIEPAIDLGARVQRIDPIA